MATRILPIAMILAAATVILSAVEEKGPRVFEGDPYAHESKAQRDARMAWWREAKFGMFIHWGVYAGPAGEHQGVRDAEWTMPAPPFR
jgi:alpha-L-fucosidase